MTDEGCVMSHIGSITRKKVLEREKLAQQRKEIVVKKAKEMFVGQDNVVLTRTVKELKVVEAIEINNSGIDAQLKYIIDRAGVSFLEDIVG